MRSQTLKTMLYKACPRCRGDLVMEQEDGERYANGGAEVHYACLQCGRGAVLRVAKREAAPLAA